MFINFSILQEVDGVIRQLHEEQGVPVLSFGEGAPLSVLMGLPQTVVVPEASAYPGYGDFVMLDGVNHIYACKPMSKEDISYRAVSDFLQKVLSDRGGPMKLSSESESRMVE